MGEGDVGEKGTRKATFHLQKVGTRTQYKGGCALGSPQSDSCFVSAPFFHPHSPAPAELSPPLTWNNGDLSDFPGRGEDAR